MKTTKMLAILVLAFGLTVCLAQLCEAEPMGTAFTYQGHLYDANHVANGVYDLRFSLYDGVSDGNQWAGPLDMNEVEVVDGYFSVEVDFHDPNVFIGEALWLEIGVRLGELEDPNVYTLLSPRQELIPVPFSHYARYSYYATSAAAGHSLDAADGSPTNAVYVDSIGRVGIGTTNPYSELEVNGSIRMNATTSPAPSIAMINNAGYQWLLRSQGDFFMIHDNTAGAERLRITGDGLVGIGTSPSAKLHIGGTAGVDGIMFPDGTLQTTAGGGAGGDITAVIAGDGLTGGGTSGDVTLSVEVPLVLSGSSSGGIIKGTNTGGGEAVYGEHSASGNFALLGTSGSGVTGVSSSDWGVYGWSTSGISVYGKSSSGVAGHFYSATGHGLIVAGGNVGIGTTSPQDKLEVSGGMMTLDSGPGGNITGIRIRENDDMRWTFLYKTWDSADKLYIRDEVGGRDVMTFEPTTGKVGIGTTTPEEKLHVAGNYIRVDGAGGEAAYIGGDGYGNDVQLGSLNPNVEAVALWNAATSERMNLIVGVLHITGGSDLAEPFAISDEEKIPEGSLVVIDDENPGKLKLSDRAYDTRVAGIISGAAGVKPGLTMSQEDILEGGRHVALAGRVYALADASYGAIKAGDLLTTSTTPGHAMKATDRERSYGTVIGKAMSGLEEGKGLVLVLVSLQ